MNRPTTSTSTHFGLLEQLLLDYSGTLFLVSHDRAFLDNVVTQTIAPEGDGVWHEYAGGYQDWADYQSRRRAEAPAGAEKRVPEPVVAVIPKVRADGKRKLSYKETRELEELPGRIAALEDEQKTITKRLEDPSLYQSEPLEAQQLSMRLSEIKAKSCWRCWSVGKCWRPDVRSLRRGIPSVRRVLVAMGVSCRIYRRQRPKRRVCRDRSARRVLGA